MEKISVVGIVILNICRGDNHQDQMDSLNSTGIIECEHSCLGLCILAWIEFLKNRNSLKCKSSLFPLTRQVLAVSQLHRSKEFHFSVTYLCLLDLSYAFFNDPEPKEMKKPIWRADIKVVTPTKTRKFKLNWHTIPKAACYTPNLKNSYYVK